MTIQLISLILGAITCSLLEYYYPQYFREPVVANHIDLISVGVSNFISNFVFMILISTIYYFIIKSIIKNYEIFNIINSLP